MDETLREALARQSSATWQDHDALAKNSLIMMVDDEPILMELVKSFLEERGYQNFVMCERSAEAFEMVERLAPDVLLLDLVMPEVTGFDILHELRNSEQTRHLAVIVLTSSSDAETKLKALELGATDFLAKPVDASELALRLRNTLASKAYQDQLADLDQLTRLPNRRKFQELLEGVMRRKELEDVEGYLLQLGLENFKGINDTLGPAVGDEILIQVASRLEFALMERKDVGTAHLARSGGDEFSILLRECSRDVAAQLAHDMLADFSVPFAVDDEEVYAAASIGISIVSEAASADELFQKASVAQKYARLSRQRGFDFYSAGIDAEARELLQLENDLRSAEAKGELELYFQPKMAVETRRIVGMEALVRWNHSGGMVSPEQFIPIAEETGLIIPIGDWILQEACKRCKQLEGVGIDITVSVNVSAHQLKGRGLLKSLRRALLKSRLSPRKLMVEITESVIMDDIENSLDVLRKMREIGVTLSIDDFGTGYSSLSYLKLLPIGELKIDQSFLVGVPDSSDDAAIVKAILALAHSLDLVVTAEGTETRSQVDFLSGHQCDLLQGFFFSKPLPFDAFQSYCETFEAPA